jgi:hypothetical protein
LAIGVPTNIAAAIISGGVWSIQAGKSILPAERHLEWTGRRFSGKFTAMGEGERPTCPKCGANLTLTLPAVGTGRRTLQCFECDRPDPMKTDKAMGWIKSGLQPPK